VSFNQNYIVGGLIYANSTTGAPMWLSGPRSHSYRGIYMCGGCGAPTRIDTRACIVLYHTGNTVTLGGGFIDTDFKVHCEQQGTRQSYPTSVFMLASNVNNPNYSHLTWDDLTAATATDSTGTLAGAVFSADTSNTFGTGTFSAGSILMPSLTTDNYNISSPPASSLFDNPSLYTVWGYIRTSAANPNMWANVPQNFSGTLCRDDSANGLNSGCVSYVPTPAINCNPDFQVDQIAAGTAITPAVSNALTIDCWRERESGFNSALQFQQQNPALDSSIARFAEKVTVASTHSPAAGDYAIAETPLEGPSMLGLAWGGGGSPDDMAVDFYLRTSVTGEYDCGVKNGPGVSATQTFIFPVTISDSTHFAHVWQAVPSDLVGTWNKDPNTIGAYGFCTLAAGSNYSWTQPQWTATVATGTGGGGDCPTTQGTMTVVSLTQGTIQNGQEVASEFLAWGTHIASVITPGVTYCLVLASGASWGSQPTPVIANPRPMTQPWTSSTILATGNQANWTNTSAATLTLAAFHIRKGSFLLPYESVSQQRALADAKHWFFSTFPVGTPPAQNSGVENGAISMFATTYPSQFATIGTSYSFPQMYAAGNSTAGWTVTFYNPKASDANCYDTTAAHTGGGAATAVNIGDGNLFAECTQYSSGALGDLYDAHMTIDSNW
jgi:hypothetical protein